ncbi:MAG: hypothetical protein JKY60_07525 [Kordiimonadaceae bacterium]|nr:hypothetical protein [Kordiimonadaceae bacterium]
MTRKFLSALYFIVGVINIVPIMGVVGASSLEALYGVALDNPATILMMQHRAALLAIVGGLLVAACFKKELRPAAAICGFVSMLSFMLLYSASSVESLAGIYRADAVAVAILTAACIWELAHLRGRKIET